MKQLKLLILLLAAALTAAAQAPANYTLSWVAPTEYTAGTPLTEPLTYTVWEQDNNQESTAIATGLTATSYTLALPLATLQKQAMAEFSVVATTADGRVSGAWLLQNFMKTSSAPTKFGAQ